jgi:hypothetical protein
MATESDVVVKTTSNLSKQGSMANFTWFLEFSGKRYLVLEVAAMFLHPVSRDGGL